jgi:hypothetical protein
MTVAPSWSVPTCPPCSVTVDAGNNTFDVVVSLSSELPPESTFTDQTIVIENRATGEMHQLHLRPEMFSMTAERWSSSWVAGSRFVLKGISAPDGVELASDALVFTLVSKVYYWDAAGGNRQAQYAEKIVRHRLPFTNK